jgi:hypothetical protein
MRFKGVQMASQSAAVSSPGPKKTGTIVRVDRHGLALVKAEDGNLHSFTFDKILRYRGEAARDIGLDPGATVLFSEDESGIGNVEVLV